MQSIFHAIMYLIRRLFNTASQTEVLLFSFIKRSQFTRGQLVSLPSLPTVAVMFTLHNNIVLNGLCSFSAVSNFAFAPFISKSGRNMSGISLNLPVPYNRMECKNVVNHLKCITVIISLLANDSLAASENMRKIARRYALVPCALPTQQVDS